MGIFKSDTGVKSIFGDDAFRKLKGLLSDCCLENGGCCASQKYTISVVEGECNLGGVTYSLTITSNFNIPGIVVVKGTYIQDNAATDISTLWFTTEGFETGDSKIASITLTKNKATQLFLIDSRGNYSNVLSFTTPNC